MNYFEEVLKFVKMTEEEFFKIFNLPDVERAEEEKRLKKTDFNKYSNYLHLRVAYLKSKNK